MPELRLCGGGHRRSGQLPCVPPPPGLLRPGGAGALSQRAGEGDWGGIKQERAHLGMVPPPKCALFPVYLQKGVPFCKKLPVCSGAILSHFRRKNNMLAA